MVKKNFWFKFEMAAWLSDKALLRCSFETRGFLIQCIAWMGDEVTPTLEGQLGDLTNLLGCGRVVAETSLRELCREGIAAENEGTYCIDAQRWVTFPIPNPNRYIPAAVRVDVLSAGKCAYCGSIEFPEVDHIEPVIMGGSNDRDNLQCLCRSCNRRKHAQSAEQFLALLGDHK